VQTGTRILTALALVSTALAASGCAGGATTQPNPTVTVTAPASVPEWTRSVNPDWDFLTAIRNSGMEFTQDWEADLEALGVDLAETDTFELRSQVCGTAMDDGVGDYNPASQTHEFWLSTFYDEVRRLGRGDAWDIPRTVAYHHCPSRFAAVGAVQELEARVR
jgi:hypothetical protein